MTTPTGRVTGMYARTGRTWGRWWQPWREGAGFQAKFLVITGVVLTLLFILVAIFAPLLAKDDPTKITGDYRQGPSWRHPFGTTRLGFDVWSQCVFGARIALQVVIVSTILAAILAVPVGLISG